MLLKINNNDFALNDSDQLRVVENLTELHDKVWETMAPNTQKAYLTDFNQYLNFCREKDLPSLASEWRLTKNSIEQFFDAYMEKLHQRYNAKPDEIGEDGLPIEKSKPYKHHSIKRKLASIRFFIGIAELPDPFKHSKLFKMYISGALNKKPEKQAQAPAMTEEIINQITSTAMDGSLLMLRDLTILNVAFDTLFRASNLVGIRIEDINVDKKTVFTQYSKTDQSGKGHYAYISATSLSLINQLKDRAEIKEGYLFRALSPKQTIQSKPITTRSLWGIYKRLGDLIDDKQNWSCHSTRTGAVITMLHKKVPLAEIMKHGDWKSTAMPARYSDQYEVAKTGMGRVR